MLPAGLTIESIVSTGRHGGEGCYRTATIVGDICIKTALDEGGKGCNENEVHSWQRIQHRPMVRFFAPVLAHAPDYSWVAMPRCEPLAWNVDDPNVPDDAEKNEWCYISPALVDFMESEEYGIMCGMTGDLHEFNLMRAPNGNIVVVDYGGGVRH